ncbi:MAG: rubredoxin [Planctomycetota bacterium]
MSDADSPFGFHGSYSGEAGRIRDEDVLECNICWHQYNPAEGDEHWQIPPGTPFAALPEFWTCPECGADRKGFMVVDQQ